jgi:hypothetical protein
MELSRRDREASRLDSEIKMTDQTKDCEACFGTGNDVQMRSPYPIRKILIKPCPTWLRKSA